MIGMLVAVVGGGLVFALFKQHKGCRLFEKIRTIMRGLSASLICILF